MTDTSIHPTADVSPQAILGQRVKVWHQAQVREQAHVGDNCIIGKNVYIDFSVHIGRNCKIQNNACLYHGLTVEDGVFIGPFVCFANDKFPRAIKPDGSLKSADDWQVSPTIVKTGASIGAHAIILPGITIGAWAMIGAGSVVTHDVPDFAVVIGNPAQQVGSVNEAGEITKRL